MDDHDEILGRVIASMRELPDVRSDATARLLIAVAAERQRERDGLRGGVHRRSWALAAAGVAAMLLAAVSLLPMARADRGSSASVVANVARNVTAIPASNGVDPASAPRSVQLLFDAPRARAVRVVGDFNGWDEQRSPMVRDEASGLWSVSMMLRPGRHVYAFVVNDTQWVRDPRAPAAPDADFGRPGSVLLVGHP